MTTETRDEHAAVTAARDLLNERINAVRVLAQMRTQTLDARAALERAEIADTAAWAAATQAGWSEHELRKVGFAPPTARPAGRAKRQSPAAGAGRSRGQRPGQSGADTRPAADHTSSDKGHNSGDSGTP